MLCHAADAISHLDNVVRRDHGDVGADAGSPIRIRFAPSSMPRSSAWNRGDIDGFMEGYARSPKTTFVSGNEVTRGWQTVRDRYAKKYDSREKMGTLTFSEVEITLLGDDAAIALGSWSLKRKDDQPHGKFTLLFRRLPRRLADRARPHIVSCSRDR